MKSKITLHRFAELNEVTDPILLLLGNNKSTIINRYLLPIDGGACAC